MAQSSIGRSRGLRGFAARAAWIVVAMMSAVLAAGCSESKVVPPPPPPELQPYPTPATLDQLMLNFRRSLDDLHMEEYLRVLHADFAFVPLPEDLADLGLAPGEHVSRDLELAITLRLFSGMNGWSGAPRIYDIEIILLEPLSAWEESTDPLFPPPALGALYDVDVRFHFDFPNGYFHVTGRQWFWAVEVAEEGGSRYYLLGQREVASAGKAVQETWGGVKGMYRP